jgi:hypothetical protein
MNDHFTLTAQEKDGAGSDSKTSASTDDHRPTLRGKSVKRKKMSDEEIMAALSKHCYVKLM